MSLFEHDNQYCKNCQFATVLSTTGDCICQKKKLVVSEGYTCKKFVLDPFKIVPPKRGGIKL